MSKIKITTSFPFYPLLIGVYAVLQLWSANIGQVVAVVTLRSFGAAFLISLIVFLLSVAVTRSLHKGALVSAAAQFLLFFYGHFFALVDQREIFGMMIGRHRWFVVLMGLVFLAGVAGILRARSNLAGLNRALNVIIPAMMLMAAVPVAYYEIRYASGMYVRASAPVNAVQVDQKLPDVYYIILDGYTRSDVLLDDYGYDNSAFIAKLKEIGFTIPACAFSNYYKTTSSMSATLNMNYLDQFGISDADANSSFSPSLAEYVIKSEVRTIFEQLGYKTVTFRGFIPSIDVKNADYYFNLQEIEHERNLIGMHTFERMLMRSTLLRPVIEQYEANPQALQFVPAQLLSLIELEIDSGEATGEGSSEAQWYRQSMYQFDTMLKVPDLPGKKFVYSHFYSTHRPYVIDEHGEMRLKGVMKEENYVPSLRYTESRILEIIQTIIEKSAVPPVIILQGDHGKLEGLAQSKILNAYYLPGDASARIYATLTPVNTFRLILSEYFGKDYPLLPDMVMTRINKQFKHVPAACDLN